MSILDEILGAVAKQKIISVTLSCSAWERAADIVGAYGLLRNLLLDPEDPLSEAERDATSALLATTTCLRVILQIEKGDDVTCHLPAEPYQVILAAIVHGSDSLNASEQFDCLEGMDAELQAICDTIRTALENAGEPVEFWPEDKEPEETRVPDGYEATSVADLPEEIKAAIDALIAKLREAYPGIEVMGVEAFKRSA